MCIFAKFLSEQRNYFFVVFLTKNNEVIDMKKSIVILSFLLISAICSAAPVFNAPAIRIQPNGDTLHCLISGDEYYHRLHDANGYTIVQNPQTGYWVYADTVHKGRDRWDVVATKHVVGTVNPAQVGLHPNIGIDRETWMEKQHYYDIPAGYAASSGPKTSGTNHGTLNNIVIFIRFSDETEISTPLSNINAMFNDSSATATSMYNYFKKVSYGKIYIPTHYYPTPNGNNVISFQDSLPRSYYMPYNATTNTNGYQNDTESRNREFSLLERAVNYVNAHSPVSTSLNLDMDNDGKVDNICFVVKGTYTGWSDLLWPHKWSLYDRYVYINGKRVYTFNLQLEGSGTHYFSSSTFCHEMFHTLGAPDLYRYNVGTDVSGVGSWDLMCSNTTPPQHMSAYMKWKYGNWLDSIPEITVPGTYTLHSLGDNTYDNCCYKIAAQEPHQWYVLEYRDNTEMFETALPGRGLLVFRIDDRYNGNASYNGTTVFDEVYLFRPNAPNDSTNGTLSQAYFSGNTSRTSFTPYTNPHPWLTNNIIDTTFSITNVTSPGVTISFTYHDLRGCREPMSLAVNNPNGYSANLSWSGNANNYKVQWRENGSTTINSTFVNATSYSLTGLSLNTAYQWRVRGICGANDSSDWSDWNTFRTAMCPTPTETTIGSGDTTYYTLPLNSYYNYSYSQMIFTSAELGGSPYAISKIAFNYAGTDQLNSKDSCIIYLGNTTQSSFAGTAMSNFVPFSQLQKVYEGPMQCVQGWNEFVLDSAFIYNGTGNLVVAIDDNSGEYNSSSCKFFCTRTNGQYRSLTYYSDSYNPDPTASSYNGSKYRRQYRADIRFSGCPVVNYYEVTLHNNMPAHGTVSGDGVYEEGETVTITATAGTGHYFMYWISNGDTIRQNPYIFTANADIELTAYFAPCTYTITTNIADGGVGGMVTGGGTYTYGSNISIYAQPFSHHSFSHWHCNNNGADIYENSFIVTVTADSSFTAYFDSETHSVSVESDNNEIGSAWFDLGDGSQEHYGTLDYGTMLTLYAMPSTDLQGMVCYFDTWSDGNSDNPRSLQLTQDTAITAHFIADIIDGIDIANNDDIVIVAHHLEVTVFGAEGRIVHLFDITGRCLSTVTGKSETVMQLPNNGVFIVKVDGYAPRKIVSMQ